MSWRWFGNAHPPTTNPFDHQLLKADFEVDVSTVSPENFYSSPPSRAAGTPRTVWAPPAPPLPPPLPTTRLPNGASMPRTPRTQCEVQCEEQHEEHHKSTPTPPLRQQKTASARAALRKCMALCKVAHEVNPYNVPFGQTKTRWEEVASRLHKIGVFTDPLRNVDYIQRRLHDLIKFKENPV